MPNLVPRAHVTLVKRNGKTSLSFFRSAGQESPRFLVTLDKDNVGSGTRLHDAMLNTCEYEHIENLRRKEWRGEISETEPARLTGLI